ncbi:MAG TPA: hypothetical protein VFD75_19000 [Pyrinomonadaceae bacterium]|nr:hypothetical protein [Pyrinomonadaceae bacterium]
MNFSTYRRKTGLNKDDGLRRGNFESLAAARIAAGEHVVDAHHVVTGFHETREILLVGATRRRRVLSAR